jgi:IS5 family transposase
MARREQGQLGLAEALVRQRPGVNARLDRIAALVEWERFERLLSAIHSARDGRPAYPPLAMFRALLLQQWYALSDAGLEEALSDRLSFRRFCGFALDEAVPDHTTICRFRGQLSERGLAQGLFEELARQLDRLGLVVRQGTLIDATLVAAAVAPPRPSEGTVSTADPDAGWAKRKNGTLFGYKAHLAVDQGSELVRAAILTGAEMHDSVPADALVRGDEQAVYADKAYDSGRRRAALAAAGIADGIMHRARRGRPLKPWQRAMNLALSRIRCAIERSFATLKRSYGWRRVRYRGLAKNAAHLHLLCLALNLRRAEVLLR